jgi:uncharacterized SAM-binding protein YcdF (DUF218 family)
MNATFNYVLSALLVPPMPLVLLALLGLLLGRRRRGLGYSLAAASVVLLVVLATPVVALALVGTLEPAPITDPASVRQASGAQAIVILGGGRSVGAPEYGGETMTRDTLERVRYGAVLARASGLPILVSGGKPGIGERTEAELMREALERELGVGVRWAEAGSNTTRDYARLSARVLRAEGIERVLLVTHAVHMRRARANFEREGLVVVPAPTGFLGREPFHAGQLVPGIAGMFRTNVALREWIAILRDRLRD